MSTIHKEVKNNAFQIIGYDQKDQNYLSQDGAVSLQLPSLTHENRESPLCETEQTV